MNLKVNFVWGLLYLLKKNLDGEYLECFVLWFIIYVKKDKDKWWNK